MGRAITGTAGSGTSSDACKKQKNARHPMPLPALPHAPEGCSAPPVSSSASQPASSSALPLHCVLPPSTATLRRVCHRQAPRSCMARRCHHAWLPAATAMPPFASSSVASLPSRTRRPPPASTHRSATPYPPPAHRAASLCTACTNSFFDQKFDLKYLTNIKKSESVVRVFKKE